MRSLLVILAVTSILAGCEKQKEHVEKFIFDNTKISHRTIHQYKFYADGKIKTNKSIWYFYTGAYLMDSVVSISQYQYTKTGKISKITDLTDSIEQVMIYDDLDSLIAEYRINSDHDTTFLYTTEYKNGRIKRTHHRMLMANLTSPQVNSAKADYRSYDTLDNRIDEFIYNNNVHEKTLVKDIKGNVTEEIHYKYDNGALIKSIQYLTLGDTLYLSQTTTNIYNNGIKDPDHFSINSSGDTLQYSKTIINDEIKIRTDYDSRTNFYYIWYHNIKGQLIGLIMVDSGSNTKNIHSYTYDSKGNEVEENEYKEMITSAN